MRIHSIALASVVFVADVHVNAEELSMSGPTVDDFSLSVPLFEADISLPLSMPSLIDDSVVGAKARKLRNKKFGRRVKEEPDAGAKAAKLTGEVDEISMPLLLEQGFSFSLSAPLFEADISLPLSMPSLIEDPVVGAKARKLRTNLGRRRLSEEVLSMSVPVAEQDFSLSVPLFEADISLPLSMPDSSTNFGRRLTEESLSLSVPLLE